MSGSLLNGMAQSAFQLAFQASPIILVNGIASIAGGMLPIIVFTEGIALVSGLLSGDVPTLDNLFAQFMPLPGSTLISNSVGLYPFANQQVAANAVIRQPTNVSMLMIAPSRAGAGFGAKLATLTALQASLTQHNAMGGTYIIATPAQVYFNCVMLGMTDVTSGESKQTQIEWQLDFQMPLMTTPASGSVLNAMMSRLTNGLQISGQPAWSGAVASVAQPMQGATAISGMVGSSAGQFA